MYERFLIKILCFQFEVLPAAKSLGLVKEGDWIQNTSSHVIGNIVIGPLLSPQR